MPVVRIDCTNAIVGGLVFNPGDGAPAGTWSDDSDATFAVGDSATAIPKDVRLAPAPPDSTKITAHVRYSGPNGPAMQVADIANGNDSYLNSARLPTSTTPTWGTVEMSGNEFRFLSQHQDPDEEPDFLILGGNENNRYYEAYLVIRWPGDVHPLQQYPRADGLSVGGGRQHYPPPNTVQRSGSASCHYPATL